MADLPDYTRYIAVNVEIPPSESGPTYVGKYQAAPADLPDGQLAPLLFDIKGRLYTRIYGELEGITNAIRAIPKPEGAIPTKGSLPATSGTYQDVVAYIVTNGKTFHLSKIAVSCDQDSWVKILMAGVDKSIEYLVSAGIPFTDWFPWDWNNLLGDGAKQVKIQAKQKTTSGIVYGEIVGEEV